MYSCKFCNKSFDNPFAKGAHTQWCEKNPVKRERTSLNIKYIEKVKSNLILKKQEISKVKCGEKVSHSMTNNEKGRMAELIAITKYLSLGYIVCEPINKDIIYDFVLERNGEFIKVQVKKLLDEGDVYVFPLSKKSKNYCDLGIDLMVGVDIDENKVFELKLDKKLTGSIVLRKYKPLNNQTKGITFAKDFEI